MKPVALALLGSLLLVSWPVAGARAQEPLSYSRASDAVVVEFRETLSELRRLGPGPSLRIHGDGRFVVHRPAYMKRAGDWSGQLTPAELDALLARLGARGVLEFDAPLRPAGAGRSGARLAAETSDVSTVEIVVRAARTPPGGVQSQALELPAEKRLRLRGLRAATRARPEDAALADLSAACDELRGMIDTPGLAALP